MSTKAKINGEVLDVPYPLRTFNLMMEFLRKESQRRDDSVNHLINEALLEKYPVIKKQKK